VFISPQKQDQAFTCVVESIPLHPKLASSVHAFPYSIKFYPVGFNKIPFLQITNTVHHHQVFLRNTNPKSQAPNPKQIQNLNFPMSETITTEHNNNFVFLILVIGNYL